MNRTLLSQSQRSVDVLTKIPSSPRTLYKSTALNQQPSSSPKHISLSRRQYHSSPTLFSSQPPSPTKPQPSKKYTQNEPIQAAPFSELGATKTVKVVVIIALSIIGTLETITYGQWIYRRFFVKEEVVEEKGGVDEWWERK